MRSTGIIIGALLLAGAGALGCWVLWPGDQAAVSVEPSADATDHDPASPTEVSAHLAEADAVSVTAPLSYLEALTANELKLALGTQDQIVTLDTIRQTYTSAQAWPIQSQNHPHVVVFSDPNQPLVARVPDNIRQLLPRVTEPDVRNGLLGLFMHPETPDLVRHEAANTLVASCEPLAPIAFALVALDAREQPRIRGYALQHLDSWYLSQAEGESFALRRLLEHVLATATDEELRREALLSAANAGSAVVLRQARLEPDADQFIGAEDVVMQIWSEQRFRDDLLEQQLLVWLGNSSPTVRAMACGMVGRWGLSAAQSVLVDLKQDAVPSVRRAAERALVKLK